MYDKRTHNDLSQFNSVVGKVDAMTLRPLACTHHFPSGYGAATFWKVRETAWLRRGPRSLEKMLDSSL
jgi:hypothetical protein